MFRKVVKALIPRGLFRQIEPYGHWAEAIIANIWYGFPARDLRVIGVTGTDGKTTTTTLVWKMLVESGYKAGFMTTVGYGTHNYQKVQHVHITTLQSFPLMKRIKQLKADGIEWLVLETSSHALAQHRTAGIPYEVGVMTNVTSDHMDYHGTFERYRDAKKRLFQLANKRGLRAGVANADDASGQLFAGEVEHPVLYGINSGTLRATNVKTTSQGSTFIAEYESRRLKVKVNLPGDFNVYNALAAVGVGCVVGLSDEQIERGVAALDSVEGRMNTIDEGQDFTVIVDYASTPGGFEAVLPGLKKSVRGRLIAVFGSAGGPRDPFKRAVQGEIAGKYCDEVVLTEEDDRYTDGELILNQIAEGSEKSGKVRDKDMFFIHDRREAIRFAINRAKAGDTVVLLGKGHERTIERADGEIPWNEAGEARAALRDRLKKEGWTKSQTSKSGN
jgi:UDP-N-acetylmuramoyl-L-alanyl-D-glutamate--2,6-diaminopimelate ligase